MYLDFQAFDNDLINDALWIGDALMYTFATFIFLLILILFSLLISYLMKKIFYNKPSPKKPYFTRLRTPSGYDETDV